jgi:predicted RNase H-like nuclease (RuvC/YqgF family)
MFNDHFTQQLLDGEDLTFDQYQAMRQANNKDAKLEAEAEKLEKEARREDDFNKMVKLDAEIEALAEERETLKQHRATLTKESDLREMNLRQEFWNKQRQFDAIFSRYNAGHPYTPNTANANKIADELKRKGAKIKALELPILATPLSPSAQLLWEKTFKPKLGSQKP